MVALLPQHAAGRRLSVLPDGRRASPVSGEVSERPLSRAALSTVQALASSLTVLGTGLTAERNRGFARHAERLLDEARAVRSGLAARLDHGGAWLDRHPDDERFAENEERWLGWLRDYAAISDGIADAEEALA